MRRPPAAIDMVAVGPECLRIRHAEKRTERGADDAPGLGSRITSAIADSGVNLRGVSGTVVGRKFVVYLGFDGNADATKAARTLKTLASAKQSGKVARVAPRPPKRK